MDRRFSRRVSFLFRSGWCLVALLGLSATLEAATPRVAFDMSYTAECRDVTPKRFLVKYPDRRVVEAKFRVSTRIQAGSDADLEALVIEITSPEQALPVVDFLPRTELDTDIAGEIEVVENIEDTASTNAGLAGDVGVEYGIIKAHAAPSAGGGRTHAVGTKETYKRLPPKQLLLASGTINRGHGVFFKLKPSNRASLEGVREFACLYLVPADWTGQSVRVSCVARAAKKSYFTTKPQTCGEGLFYVGLFLEGDVGARKAADKLARAQVVELDEDGKPRSKTPLSFAAFKPLVNHAVDASKSLFVCPIPGKRDSWHRAQPIDRDIHDNSGAASKSLDDALDDLNQLAGGRGN